MQLLRRFWVPILILGIVAVHAAVIGYVRSRVAGLNRLHSSTVQIGEIRFQNVKQPDYIYELDLHAVVDPARFFQGENRIHQMKLQIIESSEQVLRQVDEAWLADPAHQKIREQLMKVVLENLDEPFVQRVLITDWVRLPAAR